MQGQRRAVRWEREGVESAVAIRVADQGPVLFLNGKSEGSAVGDASTQIMSGMIGAILHPQPRNALVIGLGTGSTAGWLAAIDELERVDVVELEAAVIEAANAFGPVNMNAVGHPKLHTIVGDGREVVLTTRQSYDLIFSEPSNPYRAGVASLYTREFYAGVAPLLRDGGLFAQWVQMYEVDEQTIRTIYATLGSVFAHVETWQTQRGDLLLLSSAGPVSYDIPRLRARIAAEPYRSALAAVWRTADLEGFLAHYVAGPAVARDLAGEQALNTDDRTLVEYAFARHLGLGRHFNIETVEKLARARGEDRPRVTGGAVDWDWVTDQRLAFLLGQGEQIRPGRYPDLTLHQQYRLRALTAWWDSRSRNGLAWWQRQPRPPRGAARSGGGGLHDGGHPARGGRPIHRAVAPPPACCSGRGLGHSACAPRADTGSGRSTGGRFRGVRPRSLGLAGTYAARLGVSGKPRRPRHSPCRAVVRGAALSVCDGLR